VKKLLKTVGVEDILMGQETIKRGITIGLLINGVEGRYQYPIWKGLADFGEEYGVNILFFCGRSFKAPSNKENAYNELNTYRNENNYNIIYELSKIRLVEGLVLATGTLANFINREDLMILTEQFKFVPAVSLAFKIPGMASVLVDNRVGMEQALTHLIVAHELRRIVFVTGPLTNGEAIIRFQVYRDVLEKFDIPFDPDLVIEGDFTIGSSRAGIARLLDGKKVKFDAVAASNDEMAYGAFVELRARNYRIPQDAAITGFDDIELTRNLATPITTVNQPIRQQSYEAGKMLLSIIQGKKAPADVVLPTRLVVRESCGCLNLPGKNDGAGESVIHIQSNGTVYRDLSRHLALHKNGILDSMEALFGPSEPASISIRDHLEKLIDALGQDIENEDNQNRFIYKITEILSSLNASEGYLFENLFNQWQLAVDLLRKACVGFSRNGMMDRRLDNAFIQAQAQIGNIMRRCEAGYKFLLYQLLWDIGQTGTIINSIHRIEELGAVLNKTLPNLGFPSLYLVMYDSEPVQLSWDRWSLPQNGKLVAGYNEDGPCEIRDSDAVFPLAELLPPAYLQNKRRLSFIIQPLFAHDNPFGYLILGVGQRDAVMYERLREQLSNSIQISRLFLAQDRIQHELKSTLKQLEKNNRELNELSLKDELTGLYNRRGFYVLGEQHLEYIKRNPGKFSILYADLDGLKKINDTFGHNEGDYAIQAMGKILKQAFRQADIVARIGGDEFTIITSETSPGEILKIYARIGALIEKLNLHSQKPYQIAVSFGYSVYNMDEKAKTFEALVAEADQKLYQEKMKKKNPGPLA
jgi:diguanylate cyclase (GGDEF)-like protein